MQKLEVMVSFLQVFAMFHQIDVTWPFAWEFYNPFAFLASFFMFDVRFPALINLGAFREATTLLLTIGLFPMIAYLSERFWTDAEKWQREHGNEEHFVRALVSAVWRWMVAMGSAATMVLAMRTVLIDVEASRNGATMLTVLTVLPATIILGGRVGGLVLGRFLFFAFRDRQLDGASYLSHAICRTNLI